MGIAALCPSYGSQQALDSRAKVLPVRGAAAGSLRIVILETRLAARPLVRTADPTG